jgi:RNA-directed DNA polymerase
MGQVLDFRRMRAAYHAVRANGGAPGVDGMTVEAFGEDLEEHLRGLITRGWTSWGIGSSGGRDT